MNEKDKISITIDQRKCRVRIKKTTLNILGNPKYIQLLVSPEQRKLAIRSLEKDEPDAQTYKVSSLYYKSESSYELYSCTLIGKLCDIIECEDKECSFRLYGQFVQAQQMAVFSFDTIEVIETKD